MTTYKEINGTDITVVSSDPSNPLLGEVWYNIHPYSLQIIQPVVERYILVFLWDPILLNTLQLPFGVFLVIIGGLLLLLSLRSRNKSQN